MTRASSAVLLEVLVNPDRVALAAVLQRPSPGSEQHAGRLQDHGHQAVLFDDDRPAHVGRTNRLSGPERAVRHLADEFVRVEHGVVLHAIGADLDPRDVAALDHLVPTNRPGHDRHARDLKGATGDADGPRGRVVGENRD